MKANYVIKNGRVIDPSRGVDAVCDVAVCGGRIIEVSPDQEAEQVIDAAGCIVTPGLIDYHTHIFREGSGIAIYPDGMAAQGTTSAVDAGTAGTVNYEAFYKTAVTNSMLRIKGYLTVYSGGQLDMKLCEDFNPALFNVERMEKVIDKYRDNILGLKTRISKGVVPDACAMDYLKEIVALADRLNEKLGTSLRVCVHTTNSPMTAGELADCLRPGDVFCHCYQGAGNTIVQEDGSIDPLILKARERGVIFDAANGRGNFGVATAKQALKAGFLPDIISSDLTIDKYNMPPYAKNLPTIMSKYLTLGMSLTEVIRAVTETPAKAMNMEGKIGTLAPGAYADITILKEKQMRIVHKDWKNDELEGNVLLVPQLTMINGELQFCQTDFWV